MASLSIDDEVFTPGPDLATAGELPAHARIESWLEQLIVSGRLSPGNRLPTEVEIAAALGVSRMTLRQSLASLAARGLLESRRGRHGGNFVTLPRFDISLTGLPGFTEQMRRVKVAAGAEVIRATTRPASPAERAALRLPSRGRVHEIIRVRSADGEPITLEETLLPASTFPGMLALGLTGSLYELMDREYAMSPFEAHEVIEPVLATPDRAQLLRLEPGQPLLVVIRTSYAADGTPVECAQDYFRPDRTRIVLRTRVGQETTASVGTT